MFWFRPLDKAKKITPITGAVESPIDDLSLKLSQRAHANRTQQSEEYRWKSKNTQLRLGSVLAGVGSVFGGSWEVSDAYWESQIAS